MQALAAFQPLLDLGAAGTVDRVRVCRHLLDAIAAHRVGNRPGRYEPRLKKRRRNYYDWLTRPRAEIRREMAGEPRSMGHTSGTPLVRDFGS